MGKIETGGQERMKQVGCLNLRVCVEGLIPLTLGKPIKFLGLQFPLPVKWVKGDS